MTPPALTPGSSRRHRVDDYFGLVRDGLLRPEDRVELLEGVVVGVPPSGPAHATSVTKTAEALRIACGAGHVVRVQQPFVIPPDSVPEPDVAVIPGRPDDWGDRHPGRAILVVEVSESSLASDRLTKAAVYAAGGVPEMWIVNVLARRVEAFRDPAADGSGYRVVLMARPGERLALLARPDVSVAVDDLLPAAR